MTNREQELYLAKLRSDLEIAFDKLAKVEKEVQEMKRNDQSGNNSSQSK